MHCDRNQHILLWIEETTWLYNTLHKDIINNKKEYRMDTNIFVVNIYNIRNDLPQPDALHLNIKHTFHTEIGNREIEK